MEASDARAVRRVQEGDETAFREIVERYGRRVYAIAYRMTGNHGDADDVAQETFIRAYRRIGQFGGRSSFFTWLYRILINCCMDCLRRRRRRGETDFQDFLDHGEGPAASHGGGAEGNELRGAIAAALESLPPKQRTALVLHEFERMRHEDIARVMGCSEGTVRSRLHHARLKLRRRLRDFIE
ncbi:MAG: sigma-70 family RNA polymerase sigma factor [bacterium]|nr:sigma-70 family RNA polymerase sigma factor [bacterium]